MLYKILLDNERWCITKALFSIMIKVCSKETGETVKTTRSQSSFLMDVLDGAKTWGVQIVPGDLTCKRLLELFAIAVFSQGLFLGWFMFWSIPKTWVLWAVSEKLWETGGDVALRLEQRGLSIIREGARRGDAEMQEYAGYWGVPPADMLEDGSAD